MLRHTLPATAALLAPLALLLTTGCGCIETPHSSLQRLKMQEEIEEAVASGPDLGVTPDPDGDDLSPAADRDAWRERLDSLHEYLERDRCAEVLADGNWVLAAHPPDEVRMEVQLVLARCYRKIGDRERAGEAWKTFIELREKLLAGGTWSGQARVAGTIHQGMARLKARSGEDIFQLPGEEPRVGVGLARKLEERGPDEVLTETLPDGALVIFGRDPVAVLHRLGSPGEGEAGVEVQRDPEFGYYYAIREVVPDEH